jgi:hypothetical protein
MPSPSRFKNRRRGPLTFKERDLARALRAVKKTGGVEHVEITRDGSIRLVLGQSQAPAADSNSWDDVNAPNEERPA